FKAVNDGLGHLAGDALLKALAAALRERLRDSDLLARLGGDEFAVHVPHADRRQAEQLARKLQWVISTSRVDVGPRRVSVTASIGIALHPDHGTTIEELLAHADAAMYEAKSAGPSLVRVYAEDGSLARAMEIRFPGETRIREALERDLFSIHAQ